MSNGVLLMTKSQRKRQRKRNVTGYLFILPNIVGVTCFTLVPMAYSLMVSLTDWDYTKGFGNYNWIGIKNYIDVWSDNWFRTSLVNTIVLASVTVPLTICLALVLAVAIDKYCFAKLPLRLALFMPYISNVVAVSIIWVMMYSPWGPFTQLVEKLGWREPPKWLGDPFWALPAIILMMIWANIGYSIMIYTSSIQGLPADVYDAAKIDGASGGQIFRHLTLHFLSPTTFLLVITTLISSCQVGAQVQIMTRGGPGAASNVLVFYIYTCAFSFYKMGYASAMSWILFAILFIITLIQWQGQKKWVSY